MNTTTKPTFGLSLYDRKGKKLNMGDIVKVSLRGEFNFYSEVKYLADENKIAPFHTFSFHSFEKVISIPENAVKSTEERYNIWYTTNGETDEAKDLFEKYLMDWRACEHELEAGCFRIELIN